MSEPTLSFIDHETGVTYFEYDTSIIPRVNDLVHWHDKIYLEVKWVLFHYQFNRILVLVKKIV